MLARLNQREKIVVGGGLVVLLALLGWFILLSPWLTSISKFERKIVAHRHSLVKAETMRSQILQLQRQLDGVDIDKVSQRPLFSQVESLTQQVGVREQLLSMRPQPATIQGEFRQQQVEIRLKKITLSQLVKLLYTIEHRSTGVQVKSLLARPQFADRSLLDVNMVLISLEKI